MTAPDVTRSEPASTGDERTMLAGWVDYYRATMRHKCAGLSGEQLATRACPPSPLSLIGLVRHLVEMERAYGQRLADPDLGLLYCTGESPDGDIEDVTAAGAFGDLATFDAHCDRTRAVMAGFALDDAFGRSEPYTLRWVYLYLIKEYARHLGHADLLRERVDGVTGE